MDESQQLLITDVEGFSQHMSHLVSELRYVRRSTQREVEGLSITELDHLHDAGSNSIGALLAHVAAVEKIHQCRTFLGREFDEAEERLAATTSP